MKKNETIRAAAHFDQYLDEETKRTAKYSVVLSTESKGAYAEAAVFASTTNPTADIITLWSYDAYNARKGTKAEREAALAAVIAAEQERRAAYTAGFEAGKNGTEPPTFASATEQGECNRGYFDATGHRYEEPQQAAYTVYFTTTAPGAKPERHSVKVWSTSAAAAIEQAKQLGYNNAAANGNGPWWNPDGDGITAYNEDGSEAYTLSGYTTEPNPDLDQAPAEDDSLPNGWTDLNENGEVIASYTVEIDD